MGIWKNDAFFKAVVTDNKSSYNIIYSRGIDRIRIIPMGRIDEISIKFTRYGAPIGIDGLILDGSSGTQLESPYFIGFLNVEFPFQAILRYQVRNITNTVFIDCEVRFEIYRPDGWEVNLQH